MTGPAPQTPSVNIDLSPAGPIHINTSGQIAFRATITGTSNTAVTWAVDGIPGGNASVGTVTADGRVVMYQAPNAAGTHTISAVSSADDQCAASVSMIVAGSCAPEPASSLIVNVKDSPYNAKGDGITNDTAAIQAAVTAVKGTGGTVYVPSGTYLIDPTANSNAGIRLGSQMTFRMDPGATLQAMSTNTSHYVVLDANSIQNVSIVGGTLIGNRTNNSITDTGEEGCGIMVLNASHVVVEGTSIRDFWCDGVYVSNHSADVTLNNLVVDSNRRSAMSITSVDGLIVRNSTFGHSIGLIENGIFVCGSGVNVEPNVGETAANLQFLGCTFTANPAFGLTFGVSESNVGKAFVANVLADGCTSTGNGFHQSGSGIDVCATSGNQLSNNLISGTTGIGIYLRNGASDNLITGNTVSGTVSAAAPAQGWIGYGILLSQSGGNTVSGNTIENNAATGLRDLSPIYPNVTSPNVLFGNGP